MQAIRDSRYLVLTFKAIETLNPLTTTSFKFKTNGTQAQISHATLYSTKASDKFTSATKIGDVDVNNDEFEITTQATTLFEGDNWFWLTYDINATAEEGQKIDAALVSATLSDGTHAVANGDPNGDRTVKTCRVCSRQQYTNSNNKLTFKTKNSSAYSKRYEGSTDERTMTFLPIIRVRKYR